MMEDNLKKLSDQQNHQLTQLAYVSDKLGYGAKNKTFDDIYKSLPDKKSKEAIALEKCINLGMGNFVIKDCGNDPITGFGAIAFTDTYGNTGITYRGTDGFTNIPDMTDNLITGMFGTSSQSKEAELFFLKNRDKNGNNYLYGHSKGGELAQSVFAKYYKNIQVVHCLNPQPHNPYGLTPEQKAAFNSEKMDVCINEGDYVWFWGLQPYMLSRIRIIKTHKDTGFWGSHSMDASCYDEDGNIIEGEQPLWEYIGYALISKALSHIQFVGATITNIENAIFIASVAIIDFIRDDLIPAAQAVITSVANAIKKIHESAVELANVVSSFLSDVADRAKKWYKENFDKTYKYCNSNPYIQLDTTLMRSYADQLARLSSRAKTLDSNMNSLYKNAAFSWDIYGAIKNLGNLLKANMLLDYSGRLDSCKNYLNETASDFENVEKQIESYLM